MAGLRHIRGRVQKPARGRWLGAALALCLALPAAAGAQTDYGNRLGQRQGGADGLAEYAAANPNVMMGALDPAIKRWYLPQELYGEYGRRQWRYTNYAREDYLRYISPGQEGSYFYDTYGKLITRGWLVYDWRQTQARTVESSQLTKEQRYVSWFRRLVISSDASGGYHYSLLIGDEIAATLTPMTFRKTGFNGVMANWASDRVRLTGLFSRVSLPIKIGRAHV